MTSLKAGKAKVCIKMIINFNVILVFTFIPVCCKSDLYFPQSDLTLRLPYMITNLLLKEKINLITVRALKNDSTDPDDIEYHIVSPSESFSYLDTTSKNVSLLRIPEETSNSIVIRAYDKKNNGEALMELKILPVLIEDDKINCTDYIQDMCFWKTAKYRIYENQPITMLGVFGPEYYQSICSDIHIVNYKLLNGTNLFHIFHNKIFSNNILDRDSLTPPKGAGSYVYVQTQCVVQNNKTGLEYVANKTLIIDILDQDDNPPVAQMKNNIKIKLRDFTAGDRLDRNDLMVIDADTASTNNYIVRILDDKFHAFNITYDTLPVEHPTKPELPASTAIFTRVYSRTTLLPISPYKVILQVSDESLLPGFGNKSVNITLEFVGPQHHPTTTLRSTPLKRPIVYPANIRIARNSFQYTRVAQPTAKANSKISFKVSGSDAFNITRRGGIIYIANTTVLQGIADQVTLKVEWIFTNRSKISTTIEVTILNASPPVEKILCSYNQLPLHSCANAETQYECEHMCGVGSGFFNGTVLTSECSWRSNNVNGPDSTITENYETCSPNLSYCPDNTCDELEHLDHRICPQDCTIESEVHFGTMNKGGRGINSGLGICSCNDMMQCTCGLLSFLKKTEKNNSLDNKERKPGNKLSKNGDKLSIVSDAHKAISNPCGPVCLIGIIGASFFVLVIVVGSFSLWRYRYSKKGSCRDCKHNMDDESHDLRITPTDYNDHGNGLLIGLESLTNMNSNQIRLLPKSISPDPKWEFSRSRLTIEQVLGEGEFGRVLKAKAMDINGWPGLTTVAVKTLKEDACASELADLLSEYQLLKEAQHPNVIRLLGACTSPGGPIYLIIEFAEFGSLRNYLRRSRHLESEGSIPCSISLLSSSPCNIHHELSVDSASNFTITPRDILSFAWQISKGMAYLADIKLVHRDLAARNVLLATGKICKISDFGLTRDVYEDDAYLKRSKGRVPVKWMAPESLADHVYTSKSDVWSFGILLWELVTLGASPYPGVDVHNLYNLLKAGYRMERPKNCSYQLYKIIVSCWHDEPGMRPSFKELTLHWERMLEDGVEYLDLNPRIVHNQAYFTSLHTLTSPNDINKTAAGVDGDFISMQTNPVNYLSKPSTELVSKSDQVNKMQTFWQNPRTTSDASSKPGYVNERVSNIAVNHYESPVKIRNAVILMNEKPQSYMDMQGKKTEQGNLLYQTSTDTNMTFNSCSYQDQNEDFPS